MDNNHEYLKNIDFRYNWYINNEYDVLFILYFIFHLTIFPLLYLKGYVELSTSGGAYSSGAYNMFVKGPCLSLYSFLIYLWIS